MQFSVELTLEELFNLDIDVKGLVGGKDGLTNRNFKFSTLANKRKSKKNTKAIEQFVGGIQSDESVN